jgi:uncharacterized protein (DUF983 family)
MTTNQPFGGTAMILKRCAHCGRYFDGHLDGNYACPKCRNDEATTPRNLTPLEVMSATSWSSSAA